MKSKAKLWAGVSEGLLGPIRSIKSTCGVATCYGAFSEAVDFLPLLDSFFSTYALPAPISVFLFFYARVFGW